MDDDSPKLRRCCSCQVEDETVRNIMMLDKRSPEPGIGAQSRDPGTICVIRRHSRPSVPVALTREIRAAAASHSRISPERHGAKHELSGAGLELDFQRQLQLTRRAEVACRKACAGDPSERGALGIQIGVAKVGMIEHVKGFGAELHVHALRDLRVFN